MINPKPLSNYDLLAEKDDCLLMIDAANGILKVSWNGIVTAEIASYILAKGLDEVKNGSISKIILDRENLDLYTKGARLWIKEDFLMKRARPASIGIKIDKIAAIKCKTSMGSIYTHLVSSAVKIAFPSFTITEFDTENQAHSWLVETEEKL